MLSIIYAKCGWSFFSYGQHNKVIKTKKKSVCARVVSKYAYAEEDRRKYNTGQQIQNFIQGCSVSRKIKHLPAQAPNCFHGQV